MSNGQPFFHPFWTIVLPIAIFKKTIEEKAAVAAG
jgi:hypothetical protein